MEGSTHDWAKDRGHRVAVGVEEALKLELVRPNRVLGEDGAGPVASESALDDELVFGLDGFVERGNTLHCKVDDGRLVLVFVETADDERPQGVDPLAQRLRHVDDVERDVGAHLWVGKSGQSVGPCGLGRSLHTYHDPVPNLENVLDGAGEIFELEDASVLDGEILLGIPRCVAERLKPSVPLVGVKDWTKPQESDVQAAASRQIDKKWSVRCSDAPPTLITLGGDFVQHCIFDLSQPWKVAVTWRLPPRRHALG